MKNIILGIFLFCILHFENYVIGNIKVSNLWKLLLMVWLLFKVIKFKNKDRLYLPFIFLFLISLIHVFHDLESLKSSIIFLLFYLSGVYLSSIQLNIVYKVINYLRYFLVIVFIPYKFMGLESLGSIYDLENFEGGTGLTGPFANPHTASMILAIVSIINFYFLKNLSFNRYSKILNLILVISSVYFLTHTFVRTGMLMFICGILPILFNKIKLKTIFTSSLFVIFSIILIINFLSKDSPFYRRMTGESKYNKEESFEQYGSGRGLLFLHGLNIIESYNNPINYIVGIGESDLKEEIRKRTGNSLLTHNGFLDIVIIHGFIALLLVLYYLYNNLIFFIKVNNNFRSLGLGILISIFIMVFFQDHQRFYSFFILFLINSLLKYYHNETN